MITCVVRCEISSTACIDAIRGNERKCVMATKAINTKGDYIHYWLSSVCTLLKKLIHSDTVHMLHIQLISLNASAINLSSN